MSKIRNYIHPTTYLFKLLALSFVVFSLVGCSKDGTVNKPDTMLGTWNIRLQEVADEYTHSITLTNSSWSIIQDGMQNHGEWNLNGDTLILNNFTRTHEYIDGQLQIGEKPMKYIITQQKSNNFTAIPYFEKDVDSFITFVFEKE